MKNVIVRSLSGLVYIALTVGAVLGGGWWLRVYMTLLALLALREYHNLGTGGRTSPASRATDLAGLLAIMGVTAIPVASLSQMIALMAVAAMLFVLARLCVALSQTSGTPVLSAMAGATGTLYVTFPLALLSAYANYTHDGNLAVLLMFVLIWLNDTGAFCVGSMLGRHRLCQRLSPKKSWEGFWGGMVFCVLAGAMAAVCSLLHSATIHPVTAIPAFWFAVCAGAGYGVTVCLFATWGDLFESMLKRTAGVKDSGHIMPGHGGVLDRIDSLLFVAPASLAYYFIVCAVAQAMCPAI